MSSAYGISRSRRTGRQPVVAFVSALLLIGVGCSPAPGVSGFSPTAIASQAPTARANVPTAEPTASASTAIAAATETPVTAAHQFQVEAQLRSQPLRWCQLKHLHPSGSRVRRPTARLDRAPRIAAAWLRPAFQTGAAHRVRFIRRPRLPRSADMATARPCAMFRQS